MRPERSSIRRGSVFLNGRTSGRLRFHLLRNLQCVIHLDSEVTHGALKLGVAEQQLHCPEVFECDVRSASPSSGASCARHRPPGSSPIEATHRRTIRAYCRFEMCADEAIRPGKSECSGRSPAALTQAAKASRVCSVIPDRPDLLGLQRRLLASEPGPVTCTGAGGMGRLHGGSPSRVGTPGGSPDR